MLLKVYSSIGVNGEKAQRPPPTQVIIRLREHLTRKQSRQNQGQKRRLSLRQNELGTTKFNKT